MSLTTLSRSFIALLAILTFQNHELCAQDFQVFGVSAEIPESWTFEQDHKDVEHDFGVFFAESEQGGFFWLQVAKATDNSSNEDFVKTADHSPGVSVLDIPHEVKIDDLRDGYLLDSSGLESYFFVSVFKGRSYRFRIGHNIRKVGDDESSYHELNRVVRNIVNSIEIDN